jgi:hypothetical protein
MLVEYCVISGINVVLMLSGASIVIVSKHALSQWRLNKPPVQVPQVPHADSKVV